MSKSADTIAQLQAIEQNLQVLLSQKHQLQSQLLECESALEELAGAKTGYKILGTIMVQKDVTVLKKELTSKKELLSTRVASLDKQETALRKHHEKLQKEKGA